MLHAICDFCGTDAGLSAMLVTLTPFQNFARTPRSTRPYGTAGEPKSFVICAKCAAARRLPNPYESYAALAAQEPKYEKTLDNYTDADHLRDGGSDDA